MPILGFHSGATTSGEVIELAVDHKYLNAVSLPRAGRVPKINALVDGRAEGGSGDGQPLRAVIYDAEGSLLGESEEVIVTVNSELDWAEFRFAREGGVPLEAGDYLIGLIAGGPAAARIVLVGSPGTHTEAADTYGVVRTKLTADTLLPTATILVESTSGFDDSGTVLVNGQAVAYTSKELTKFKGCSGGSGAAEEGGDVAQEGASVFLDPISLLVPVLTGSSSYTVTNNVLASSEGVPALLGEDVKVSKSVYGAGAESNTGFFALTFTKAGTYTVAIYCYMPANWDGGDVQWNAEGYTGSSEVDIAKALASGKGSWQRVVTQVTVLGGDLVGNMVTRAVPGFPTSGRKLFFAGLTVTEGTTLPAAPGSVEGVLSVFATYFEEPALPAIDDAQIARYPFSYAQAILGSEPPLEGSAKVASCTWHGTFLHPDRGSFLLVQREGKFSGLVGQRVRVSTFSGKSVVAYVITEADLDEDDISLTRRLFMELGPLALESLTVRIEQLSATGAA